MGMSSKQDPVKGPIARAIQAATMALPMTLTIHGISPEDVHVQPNGDLETDIRIYGPHGPRIFRVNVREMP